MTAPLYLPRPLADSAIVERVFAAVMEHKLRPGAKLAENVLCEAFKTSRAQIRRVLVVLASRGVGHAKSQSRSLCQQPQLDRRARGIYIYVGDTGRC